VVQSVLPQETRGETPPLLVGPLVSGSTIATTVENNAGVTLLVHTAIQFLTPVGVDVVPPVVGPDFTIASGSTSTWVHSLPPLPDGFLLVPVSATSMDPPTGVPMFSSFDLYFQVAGGTPTAISFHNYYAATASELGHPPIE